MNTTPLDPRHLPRLLLFVVSLSIVCGVLFISPGAVLTLLFDMSNNPVFLLVVVLGFLVRPIFGVPVAPFLISLGFLYGFFWGTLLIQLGTLVTATPLYVLGLLTSDNKSWLSSFVPENTRGNLGHFRGVFAGVLSPAPLDAVAYTSGLAGVPSRTYFSATFLGCIPWSVGFAFAGASMDAMTTSTPPEIRILVLVMGSISLAIVLPVVYRYARESYDWDRIPI